MVTRDQKHVDALRGSTALAVDAIKGITELVEEMHRTIASGPAILGRPLELPTRLMTGAVYKSIRGVAGLVGSGIDAALEQAAPLLGESAPGERRELLLAVLNGVLGDYLHETQNPLETKMRVRVGGHPLVLQRDALRLMLPGAGSKVLVLVHGSCGHDLMWNWKGHDHGAALAREFGYTAVYLHYNGGLHISTNGRLFAELLDELAKAWPVPMDELAIVAHSMGGLVSRSACHVAEDADFEWRAKLTKLVCLGSPHHGAPLERSGNLLESVLGVSDYSAPLARLGKIRSAGITDMRFGYVLDEHWQDRDRFERHKDARTELALPDGVACYAVAGTTAKTLGAKLPGDGLVSVDSALGRHKKPELTLRFPAMHQVIALDTHHLDLLGSKDVYASLRTWFE